MGPLKIRLIWPAKDGHVAIAYLFGSAIGPFTRRLMQWICEASFCDEATRDKDWIAFGSLFFGDPQAIAEYERLKQVVEDFTASKTKAELLQGALERVLLIAPITTIEEVVQSEQLATRGYWRALEHPELDQTFRYPGQFAKFSTTPIIYRRRPPTVGEHNREIYGGELGFTERQLAELQSKGVI